jgi:Mn-dependent DtxR family transcriptional regulator
MKKNECIEISNLKLTRAEVKYLKELGKCEEKKECANLVKLSQLLGIKPSSVQEIIKKLEKKGLVKRSWGKIDLSEKGKEVVKELNAKRRIMENFFYFILKIDPKKASIEANNLDYIVSCELAEKMLDYLEKKGYRNNFCIHGKRLYKEVIKKEEEKEKERRNEQEE